MSISIPAFHVSDQSEVKGAGDVFIASRKSGTTSGIFSVKIAAHFNPPDPYPAGTLTIKVDLTDGALRFQRHLDRTDQLVRQTQPDRLHDRPMQG
jgi:hypothetical protein